MNPWPPLLLFYNRWLVHSTFINYINRVYVRFQLAHKKSKKETSRYWKVPGTWIWTRTLLKLSMSLPPTLEKFWTHNTATLSCTIIFGLILISQKYDFSKKLHPFGNFEFIFTKHYLNMLSNSIVRNLIDWNAQLQTLYQTHSHILPICFKIKWLFIKIGSIMIGIQTSKHYIRLSADSLLIKHNSM